MKYREVEFVSFFWIAVGEGWGRGYNIYIFEIRVEKWDFIGVFDRS